MDISELKRLAAAVPGWNNCNQAWLDTREDNAASVVGHIDEDGNTYPVLVVDCEQYFSPDSMALAKFYAAANPAAVLELVAEVDRLRVIVDSVSAVSLMRLQAENERLRKIATAARNLITQRGRHNTEIAYARLVEVVTAGSGTSDHFRDAAGMVGPNMEST